MLTVIRELAEEAEDPRQRSARPAALLEKLVERGEDALARTPDQLAVLKEAGVVDAGGAGLLEIVRGVRRPSSGEPLARGARRRAHEAGSTRSTRSSREFRYCTVFVVEGEELDADALEARARAARRLAARRRRLDRAQGARPHRRPGRGALARDGASGRSSGVEIANMHRQTDGARASGLEPDARDPGRRWRPAWSSSCPGPATVACSRAYGATRVIEGGQTMNPSTEDIVAAIDATPRPR